MATIVEDTLAQNLALWAVVQDGEGLKAMLGTEILVASSGLKSLAIRWLIGKDSPEWIHLVDELEDYARSIGCTRLETYARKGWAKRLSEYKLSHVLLEKDL